MVFVVSALSIGRMISVSSGMRLTSSIWWFAKRSLRKETLFVIAFVSGLTALGVRRLQTYANQQAGETGLSNVLAPGDIGHLVVSDAIALRIRFDRDPTFGNNNPENYYFRAMVLDRVMGNVWSSGTSRLRAPQNVLPDDITYHVALSPKYGGFAPVLDYGVATISNTKGHEYSYGRDNGVFSPFEFSSRWINYRAVSRASENKLAPDENREQLLQLPRKVTDRVRALGQSMVGPQKSANTFINNLRLYLTDEHFLYTLTPGDASSTVDDFLFRSKAGFCEHYAAAATLLARLAGIPSRVVSGFMGGTWDSASRTLLIRDLDAHAWSEIWDKDSQTWLRVDPVTFLAQDRIRLGSEEWLRSIGAALPEKDELRQNLLYAALLMQLDAAAEWLQTDFLDRIVSFVLDYGAELVVVGIFGFVISYYFAQKKRQTKRIPVDRVERITTKLNQLLGKSGYERKTGEGVLTWIARAADGLQPLQSDLRIYAESYERYCYSGLVKKSDLTAMTLALRSVRNWIRGHGTSSARTRS